MLKFKNTLILLTILVFGTAVFMKCTKENVNDSSNDLVDNSTEIIMQKQSIVDAEQSAYNFRQDLISKVPIFKNLYSMKGFTFDESQFPELIELSSTVSSTLDTVTILATDVENNSYKVELTTLPYGLQLKNNGEKWRWPTANEWTCLGISLSGAILSAGVGTFATVANFVAIMAVEKKREFSSKKVRVQGWHNGVLEFTFEEEVYDEGKTTHMDAMLTIYEVSEKPIFVAKGLIKGEYDNDVVFSGFDANQQIEWNNIGNPGDLKEIPKHVFLYGEKGPYKLYSARNALLGEMVRLVISK